MQQVHGYWFVALLLIPFGGPGCRSPSEKLGEVRVQKFEFRGSDLARGGIKHQDTGGISEAAVKLARQARVPICLEPAEAGDGDVAPIELAAENAPVATLLQDMVKQDPRYTFRERLGVIEVLPVGAAKDSSDCLNMTIPILHVNYPSTAAIASLRCQIQTVSKSRFDIVFDPLRAGCAVVLPGARPPDGRPIRATFLFEPVRDILDRIVADSGEAAWVAHFSRKSRGCDSLVIGTYSLPSE